MYTEPEAAHRDFSSCRIIHESTLLKKLAREPRRLTSGKQDLQIGRPVLLHIKAAAVYIIVYRRTAGRRREEPSIDVASRFAHSVLLCCAGKIVLF
jgi:hypothetical protein